MGNLTKKGKNATKANKSKDDKNKRAPPELLDRELVSEDQSVKKNKDEEKEKEKKKDTVTDGKNVMVASSSDTAKEQIISSADDKKRSPNDELHDLMLGTPDLTSVLTPSGRGDSVKEDETYFLVMSKILTKRGKERVGRLEYTIADKQLNIRKYPDTSLRLVTVGAVSEDNPIVFEEEIPPIDVEGVIGSTQVRGYAMRLMAHYGVTTPMSLSEPDIVHELSGGIPIRWVREGYPLNTLYQQYYAMRGGGLGLMDLYNNAI